MSISVVEVPECCGVGAAEEGPSDVKQQSSQSEVQTVHNCRGFEWLIEVHM